MKLGILSSHPIQYHSPWFRALAKEVELHVFFAHKPGREEQGEGFGVQFEWDTNLLDGFPHSFLANVSRSPNVNHFSGCDTPSIAGEIAKRDFDALIVMGWHLKSYWQAARACRRKKIPVLARCDSHLLTPRPALKKFIKAITHRFALRRFDGFLASGQRAREYLQHYGVNNERIFIVPHAVDNDWFASRAAEARSRRAEIRAELGAKPDEGIVLFVGKFISEKRVEDLIDALAILQKQSKPALGIFVGAGELEKDLRAQADRFGARIRFDGFRNQTELPRYYAAADVVVLPSAGETWGLVVNEAMACGLPAIVSDRVGCAPDLIEEGKTGFTFSVESPLELAHRIGRVLSQIESGHDFRPAVLSKISQYNVPVAARRTIEAAEQLARKHG